jgi:hypothetical protein
MDKQELFKRYLDEKKNNLLTSIEKTKDARDNAPSAMESHSDTRRSQAEKLVVALEIELDGLLKIVKRIVDIELLYLEVEINSQLKKFLIVPKDMGGIEIDKIRLISIDTPLGIVLKDKRSGDVFEFNSQRLKVLNVE